MATIIVLTGGPGSGKSSVIQSLEYDYHQRVIHESAEDIIRLMQAKGYQQPWNLPKFQDYIVTLQMQREEQVQGLEEVVFADRGILDGISYCQHFGNSLSELMKQAHAFSQNRRYFPEVFLLELGPACQRTDVRREDYAESFLLQELQYKNYTEAGYTVHRIPFTSVDERTGLILEKLGMHIDVLH